MFGMALALLASLQAPQDTATLDAPVYANEAYGVSVPRPFADWVFEPGTAPQTTTVIIFHPRAALLRDQLWGALILATFPGPVDLRRVTDERIESTWRRLLGRTYELIASDSLTIGGFPAIRTEMSGAIRHVALDVEEYAIARDSVLVILQLRYPRGLPHDSVATGYRRVVGGIKIRGAPAPPAVAQAPPPPVPVETGAVPRSPFRVSTYDALLHYDSGAARLDAAVRVDAVNDGSVPAESLAIWTLPAFTLDSVRDAAGSLVVRAAGGASAVRLQGAVDPGATATLTVYLHAAAGERSLPAGQMELTSAGAYVATDWLPKLAPAGDSLGQPLQTTRPGFTLRFDLPREWRALAQGRQSSDGVFLGRRRMVWRDGDVAAGAPAFVLGPYRAMTRRLQGLVVSVWLRSDDSLSSAAVDAIADTIRAAWRFCGTAFGRLPIGEISVVAAGVPQVQGFVGLILMPHPGAAGADSASAAVPGLAVLTREVARTWWGGSVAAVGPGAAWILESFPAWAAVAGAGVMQGDSVRQRLVREAEAAWRAMPAESDRPLSRAALSAADFPLLQNKGVAAIEAARRAVGEARFREDVREMAVEHRGLSMTLDDVLAVLGPVAEAVLRPYLY